VVEATEDQLEVFMERHSAALAEADEVRHLTSAHLSLSLPLSLSPSLLLPLNPQAILNPKP
jgi:hypothetical protein